MKVWELINELSKYPAGKDVNIVPPKGEYGLAPSSIDDPDTADVSQPIHIYTDKQ